MPAVYFCLQRLTSSMVQRCLLCASKTDLILATGKRWDKHCSLFLSLCVCFPHPLSQSLSLCIDVCVYVCWHVNAKLSRMLYSPCMKKIGNIMYIFSYASKMQAHSNFYGRERLLQNSGSSWAFVSAHTKGHTLNYLKIDCNLILWAIEMRLLVRTNYVGRMYWYCKLFAKNKITFNSDSCPVITTQLVISCEIHIFRNENQNATNSSFRHAILTRANLIHRSSLSFKSKTNSTPNRYCPINFKLIFHYAWLQMNRLNFIIKCFQRLFVIFVLRIWVLSVELLLNEIFFFFFDLIQTYSLRSIIVWISVSALLSGQWMPIVKM